MIGGTNAPPELAAASIPPAIADGNPDRFINGIVNVPVVAVFATAEPDNDPIIPLLSTATFAGAPTLEPNTRLAKFRT